MTPRLVQIFTPIVAKVSTNMLAELQAYNPKITGVHYQYGHYNDIKAQLISQGKIQNNERYPLVVLFEDFKISQPALGYAGQARFKMMILFTSQKAYTRPQRETLVFDPVLEPVYVELIRQIKRSGKFSIYGPLVPERIDRPHWGDPGLYKNEGYLFDDCLDGIELNFDLKLNPATCVPASHYGTA